jgi:hypothetical protein
MVEKTLVSIDQTTTVMGRHCQNNKRNDMLARRQNVLLSIGSGIN